MTKKTSIVAKNKKPVSKTSWRSHWPKYDPMLNAKLADYTIGEKLGQGAYGAVYKARAPNGDEVAIKLAAFEKFTTLTEPKIMSALMKNTAIRSSPHIVKFYGGGMIATDDRLKVKSQFKVSFTPDFFLVYELVRAADGLDPEGLLDHVSKDTWFDLMRQLLDAVALLHAQGFSHRDLHWGNVMVRKAGGGYQLVVVDFGLACSSDTQVDVSCTEGPMADHTRKLFERPVTAQAWDTYMVSSMFSDFIRSDFPEIPLPVNEDKGSIADLKKYTDRAWPST